LSSDDPLTVTQNNKRKHEIQIAWVRLFRMMKHYKVAHFVKEDLNGINKSDKFISKEGNRKVRNLWHRMITDWQIEKRCAENGIELIEINPAYTSFIGNMLHDSYDATNAAIEICRRGMFKFNKGNTLFYPAVTGTISDTMSKFAARSNVQLKPRDVQKIKDCDKWPGLLKIAKNNGLRWRWDWNDLEKAPPIFSMDSTKSKVKIVKFS
jgi:IS605 OrfB family transposase